MNHHKKIARLEIELKVLRKAFADSMEREERLRAINRRMAKRIAKRWNRNAD